MTGAVIREEVTDSIREQHVTIDVVLFGDPIQGLFIFRRQVNIEDMWEKA